VRPLKKNRSRNVTVDSCGNLCKRILSRGSTLYVTKHEAQQVFVAVATYKLWQGASEGMTSRHRSCLETNGFPKCRPEGTPAAALILFSTWEDQHTIDLPLFTQLLPTSTSPKMNPDRTKQTRQELGCRRPHGIATDCLICGHLRLKHVPMLHNQSPLNSKHVHHNQRHWTSARQTGVNHD
jgi:hypothetical protein